MEHAGRPRPPVPTVDLVDYIAIAAERAVLSIASGEWDHEQTQLGFAST